LGTFGWGNENHGLEKRSFFQGHGGLESLGLGCQGLGRQGLGLESQGLVLGLVSQGLGLGCQGLGDKGLDNITDKNSHASID